MLHFKLCLQLINSREALTLLFIHQNDNRIMSYRLNQPIRFRQQAIIDIDGNFIGSLIMGHLIMRDSIIEELLSKRDSHIFDSFALMKY